MYIELFSTIFFQARGTRPKTNPKGHHGKARQGIEDILESSSDENNEAVRQEMNRELNKHTSDEYG